MGRQWPGIELFDQRARLSCWLIEPLAITSQVPEGGGACLTQIVVSDNILVAADNNA
jgi:hypothetical protein